MEIYKKLFLLIFLICMLTFNGSGGPTFARDDYIPRTCDGMDKEFTLICEVAKHFKTPLYATATVFFFSGIESTASVCNFLLNDRFYDARSKILTSTELKNAYNFFTSNFDSTQIGDKNTWCRQHYPCLALTPRVGLMAAITGCIGST